MARVTTLSPVWILVLAAAAHAESGSGEMGSGASPSDSEAMDVYTIVAVTFLCLLGALLLWRWLASLVACDVLVDRRCRV